MRAEEKERTGLDLVGEVLGEARLSILLLGEVEGLDGVAANQERNLLGRVRQALIALLGELSCHTIPQAMRHSSVPM